MNKNLLATLTAVLMASSQLSLAGDQPTSFSAADKTVSVYTTAKDTDKRLSLTDTLKFGPASQPGETEISIFVNPDARFQSVIGIGGAITDASAETFAKLKKDQQAEFLTAYYDTQKGIGYSFARTTIHSSDFSSGSYTYITEGDKDLKSFNIKHDYKYRIPLLKKVIDAAGGRITTFASPWSAPAFMKNTNNMLQGGKLLPEYSQAWATYYTKFVKAYEKEGIPIWAISVQNEPMAKQTWESMLFTAEDERDFLKNYLGPTMAKEGLGDKKIIVWDHNRDLMTYRADVIYKDPEASKYAWGMGYHWYETWTGGEPMYDNIKTVRDAYPNKHLLLTEAAIEKFSAERYQFWGNGERYGKSMINDFNSGAEAWTDWNILLDQTGGPNHVGNFCFSPLHGDTTTGKLIYTPPYYYIGHFSKFIRPDAQRIGSASSRSPLLTTSFINKDGKVATVVMNQSDAEISYNYIVGTSKTVAKIPAHAIQTLVF